MKLSLFIIGFILSFCVVNGQISLTSNNIVRVNDLVTLAKDTIPDSTIAPGIDGASLVWDFSSLTAHTYDTMFFQNPADTPYDTSFTGDNVAAYISDFNGYGYFNKTSTGIEMIGLVGDLIGNGVITEIPINPSETIAKFPFTYQDSYLDTSGITIIMDTIKMEQTTYKEVSCSAWGSVITPTGTFNALRLKNYRVEHQTVYIWATVTWVPVYTSDDTIVSYEWWTDNVNYRYPLVSFEWDTINDSVVGDVEFLIDIFNNAPEIVQEDNNVKVFPNPANSNLFITGKDVTQVDVFSVDGKNLLHCSFTGRNKNNQIDLSVLPKGLYIAKIRSKNGTIVSKNIIVN
ncbi:MAG: hypothetical protein Kow0068_04180 [Marinilabiliales bacterium]